MLKTINHSAGSEWRKLMGFHGHFVLYKLLAKKKKITLELEDMNRKVYKVNESVIHLAVK